MGTAIIGLTMVLVAHSLMVQFRLIRIREQNEVALQYLEVIVKNQMDEIKFTNETGDHEQ